MKKYLLSHILKQKQTDIHIEVTTLNGAFDLHSHDFCELVFIVSGQGGHIVGDTVYEAKGGDVFVLKGREKHGFAAAQNLRLYNIMFNVYDLHTQDCRDLAGFWTLFLHDDTENYASFISTAGETRGQMQQWCRQMLQEYTQQAPGYRAVCHGILLQMITRLSREYPAQQEDRKTPDYALAKAVVYMQTNFAERISVEFLAQMTGFSPRHFSRRFSGSYGMPPMEFLNEIRLNRAKWLLEKEDTTVMQAAQQCGFTDSNYFSKVFKRKYACTPTQYMRNSAIKNN